MPRLREIGSCRGAVLVVSVVLGAFCAGADGALTLLGVQYQPDQAFPEHDCFWPEQYPGPCAASSLGGHARVFLRNTGASAVTVQDVMFEGFSLKDVLALRFQVVKRQPASIWLADLTQAQLNTLVAAGEPVWYKMDPNPIPAGGTAQVVVRLRVTPTIPALSLQVLSSAGTVSASIPVAVDAPQVASVGFSSDLSKAYLYWRRGDGTAPTSILMDGIDVTANSTTSGDPTIGMAVTVLQPAQPLAASSYHVFQGVYADGKKATAGLRAWVNKFIYGTWGGAEVPEGDDAAARAALIDFTNHGMNGLVQNGSSVTSVLMKTSSGRQFVASQGYGFVIDEINKWSVTNPLMWFIRDEPDWADYRVYGLPPGKNVASLAQMCLQRGEELRAGDPTAPTTVNVNAYGKPYCWYNYGNVPDVFMTNPYYQARMREAYWTNPARIPLYQKATYIYAVTQLANSSCEPNPLHVLLYSCEWKDSSGAVFPFAPPETKRLEVYYALAGGAKGLAYWWYPPGQPSNGVGDGSPAAQLLWREMGLLGNEIKTAAPLLVASHPISLAMQATTGVWVRALAIGGDTLILVVLNEQHLNNEQGCQYTPVADANVNVTLPAWIASPSAFEITASGLGDVSTQVNGNQLQLGLGTLDLTRMVVVTSNPQLRTTIQQRYDQQVEAAVCAFAPDVCAQAVPPSIAQHPQPVSACAGTVALLNVVASGPGTLSYQWQKNQVDLTNGGRVSGATTKTLTIAGSDNSDTGSYRCVVSNAHGSVTSNAALLTVIGCNPGCLNNLGFEAGFTNGVGNGWTKFVRQGNVTCSEGITEKHSGLRSQQIYSPNRYNDGGVYQQLVATPGQPYTVKAWIKVHSPEVTGNAEGFFGIDPTGGTDPNSPNILWASKPWEYWSQDAWTVTAQSSTITVYLRGRSTRSGQTAYIWVDDMEVAPGAPTALAPQVLGPTSVRWRWEDLAIETGYRVRDQSETVISGLLPPNTTQWLEATGIVPNTQYTRWIHAVNDCGESDPTTVVAARSLSVPPDGLTIVPSSTTPTVGGSVVWTAVGGFGPGTVQYYRYVWDQEPIHEWTGSEAQWSGGTIATVPASAGAWYLHVQGYNSDNVANGTYDYELTVGVDIAVDLDNDGDVDGADFVLFDACFSGPAVPVQAGCENRDFDDDVDVDQSDFGLFQRCYSGENIPADAGCAD